MLLDLITLFVGFLCLFVALLMLFNSKPNHKTNAYLIVMLILVSVPRLFYAIEVLGFTSNTYYSLIKINPLLSFYIVPVYYLFISRLINGTGVFKKELLHFIFPTVLILINLVFVDYRINRLLFLCYSVLYFVFMLAMVKKFISRKNPSMLDRISYRAIKNWLLIMITITILLIIYTNYVLVQDLFTPRNLSSIYRYPSLVWLGLLLYMFKNPVIIFGEYALLKNIQLNESQDFLIWKRKPLIAIEEKDKIVNLATFNKIDSIILEIKMLQKSASILSKTTLTAETLAKELKTPRRHLDFVFKYYCHYSINDFSNLVKVNYALSLINDGYLDKYTMASLGEKCLFNSRFTFSKNFKKFIGVSISDYLTANGKDYRQLLTG